MKLAFLAVFGLTLLAGCTSSPPRVTKVNGHTIMQTDRKFLGMPIWTSEDEVLTEEQRRARAEFNADMRIEERQKTLVFWFGAACLGCAIACVGVGYFTHGWKFWGGLALLSLGIGALSWGFEHLIPYLKWVAGGIVLAGVGWTMWRLRHFSVVEFFKKRKAAE